MVKVTYADDDTVCNGQLRDYFNGEVQGALKGHKSRTGEGTNRNDVGWN